MDTVKINSNGVKMIAHRGVSGVERENTCPAFIAAGNRSYFGVETDVHKSGDGKFVIIHDETTERVSGGRVNINVEERAYDEYKDIMLPDLDGSTVRQDIRIPLLSDYIAICKKYNKICVLELKNRFEGEDIDKMVEEIKALGYLENMIFISFSMFNCKYLREILPDAKIQYLTSQPIDDKLIDLLLNTRVDLDIYFKSLTPEGVKLLHSYGIEVNCWTVDNPDDAKALIEMGVDYITSNILE